MSTIDLHDLTLPTLPEWGPDVPGTPVEVIYWDGTLGLAYGWRDGRSTIANPDRERRTSPAPWGRCRITAVLADDPTRWPAVDADERVELGEYLVGARVCGEWDGATTVGTVARVGEDGRLWTEQWRLIARPLDIFRVHPADLAAAREAAATPKPPTCWDEWKPGDVWAGDRFVLRMGDDRVLRLATDGCGWVPTERQPGGPWVAITLSAPTEEHMARVAAADEAARLPEEPPIGSVVLDGDGRSWQRGAAGWRCADAGPRTWVVLNDRSGPVAVIHRAEP